MSNQAKSSRAKITKTEAKSALLRSGYLAEGRIEDVVRRRERYYVAANAPYRDPETGRTRELDVYGMCADSAGPGAHDFLFLVLLVECINNPQPIAFFTKQPLMGWLHRDEIKVSGLPIKFPVAGKSHRWQSFGEYLRMDKYHHYCRGSVATQFCSFTRKKGSQPPGEEWMALHEDGHFDAFRKLCDAVEDSMRRHFEGWRFRGHESVNIEMFYPVLVVQGDLLAAKVGKKSVTLRRVNHIQYRRAVINGQREIEYQVDVVNERFFPRFLRMIEDEVVRTARRLRRRHKAVRGAIRRIESRARRAQSFEKRLAAMAET